MRLFTIGDSISQGFMSAAAARTESSFSTLIAAQLGLDINVANGYRFPPWVAGGIPLNLELIMRALARRYGRNISGFEWLTVLQTINDVVNTSEEHYERGDGAVRPPRPGGHGGSVRSFHNVSVRGFDVTDAWKVTPAICREAIAQSGAGFFDNGFLTGPDFPFYRTALEVLNPSDDSDLEDHSQLTWLDEHARAEGGVENLILWLGANNALGTVLSLTIKQTPDTPGRRPVEMSHVERAAGKWNLWHPRDFDAEYDELFDRVDRIMRENKAADWKVFVGTVPLVTIAPLAKGVGPTTTFDIPEDDELGQPAFEADGRRKTHPEVYHKFYTYFPFDEPYAQTGGACLNRQQALLIDNTIRSYNRTIKRLVADANLTHGSKRYHIVDLAEVLRRVALKRNDGHPTYAFPPFFEFKHPMVDSKYYFADTAGQLKQGGLFSLDGVHPTPIFHGLIAWEFLKVMRERGVEGPEGGPVVADFTDDQWRTIFANDLLYSSPIPLMGELFENRKLAEHLLKFIKLIMG